MDTAPEQDENPNVIDNISLKDAVKSSCSEGQNTTTPSSIAPPTKEQIEKVLNLLFWCCDGYAPYGEDQNEYINYILKNWDEAED